MRTTISVDPMLWARFHAAALWNGETMEHALAGMVSTYVQVTNFEKGEARPVKK